MENNAGGINLFNFQTYYLTKTIETVALVEG